VPKESTSLPHVVDLEHLGNCRTHKSKETIVSEIEDYIEHVSQYYGKALIIYSTEEFYSQYLLNKMIGTEIWIRNIYHVPTLADNRKWLMWQYANRGRVKGIEKNVDLNVFSGSVEQFKHFISE